MIATSPNGVRARRDAQGVTQADLAARVGLSRQALSAIETGRATPSVDVAIRLSRALDTSVEVLFGNEEPRLAISLGTTTLTSGGRLALAHVRGQWAAHALGDDGLRIAADAVAEARMPGQVRLVRPEEAALENVAIAGCAPAIGILADRLNARSGPGRFVWFGQSSGRALAALSEGRVHVAGVHLVDAETNDANITDVRQAKCPFPVTLVTLGSWHAGLVLPAGNPMAIRSVSDLLRDGLRIVTREPESGAQRLLDRCLRIAGIPSNLPGATSLRANGHLDVARLIWARVADVGIATLDAALALGLAFVPLAVERFDLVFETSLNDDRRLTRLLEELSSGGYRTDLASLGYEVGSSGAHVIDIAA